MSTDLKEKMVYTVSIRSHNMTFHAEKGELLADKILESGINISLYCRKRGLCGKCFVEIIEGPLPPLDEQEKMLLTHRDLPDHFRLACKYKITSSLSLNIPQESLLQKAFILKTGLRLPLIIDPPVKKFFLELKKPHIGNPCSALETIETSLRKKQMKIDLSLLKNLPQILKESDYKVTVGLYEDEELLTVEPGDTTACCFGLAVDIGTTTLVVELVNMNTGDSLDTETDNNSQTKYGADIISRISYAYDDPNKLDILRDSVVHTLSSMIRRLLARNKVPSFCVHEIAFAGNTAMSHFLLGIPLKTLAVMPFHAAFSRLPILSARDLGFELHDSAKAYLAPNIRSFVGGDISAGLLATNIVKRKGNHLFIDLGTNGEIVLKTGNKYLTTSTAAGPAFEGMNISAGMLAVEGAIYKAENKNKLLLSTIGDRPPRGICGTGLIDLIALFLKDGRISPSGKIDGDTKKIKVTDGIFITQKDIREVQLATAAIKTGIRMILQKNKLTIDQLDSILIGGAFGSYLNIKNSVALGLLPDIAEKKIVFVGNSSLAGAKALLLSHKTRRDIEALIKKVSYISLATDPQFQDLFIAALEFGSRIYHQG